MDISAKKLELLDWLLHIEDESILKKVLAFRENLQNNIVAHDVKGYPINKEEYINLVKEADARIGSGKYTTMEDLENEILNIRADST